MTSSAAAGTIHILCPSGHRRKVQLGPNSNLLQALEDVCRDERLDASEWGLIYQRNPCDLTVPWRMLRIPTNATLEMKQLEQPRSNDDVCVQLQLPDNSRYPGWFEPTVTLQEMLDWYRIQPESMVAALEISMGGNNDLCPTCSYMSEEVIGEYALSNTSLRELGLTGGTAVIRYNLRPVSDRELQKINNRIDDKIVRRRQQESAPKTKASTQPSSQSSKPRDDGSRTTATSNSSRSSENPIHPPLRNDEYSIFRDPLPSNTRSHQGQSRTLAEELGLNLSLEPEPLQRSASDLRDFKFSPVSRGKDLYHNEADDRDQATANVKPCDRRAIAYDITKIRSSRDPKEKRAEEVPESFYELTAEDLRSVLNSLHEESSDDKPLETQAMRDRARSASTHVYEQIAIRFVVNARYILQGLFRPEEPVSRLIDFARTHLVCPQMAQPDFYLYTTPPRTILSDLKKPLSNYDLIPSAYVHLGHRTIAPLNVQLASNVPVRTIDEAKQIVTHYVFNRSRPRGAQESTILYNERPTSATSMTTSRPSSARTPRTTAVDDKQLREKLKKFLPPRK